ncbi:MFS transporter [Agrococcus sp. ARC_14]|uniref:MFS transporter n=1 Tax=Agrococcus sp. ARC_14 TaxID=2919927 RepID=UPI001F0577F3|nr:MFS transporter [Agrococcus sp. ARC_14]MCH1881842.1 MFS transporter [Agrococcus sp. ARC_14]
MPETAAPPTTAPTTSAASSAAAQPLERVPGAIWLVAGGIFAMVTSEFMAAGLLPAIAADSGVTLGAAAMLISGFALGQVAGAWLLGMPLSRFGPRPILAALLITFAIVQTVGVLSPWPVMLAMRVVSGLLMSAYFSIALGTATRLVTGAAQPRATAAIFTGVTVGTTLGLPLATFAGTAMAWQWAFHLDTILVLLAAGAIVFTLPKIAGAPSMPLRDMLQPLASGRLWLTFATAGLAIGGTLLGFGFFSAILQERTGVAEAVVPWLLALYGAASVVGNWAVGRLTSFGAARVLGVGLAILAAGLLAFWAAPDSLPVVIVAMLAIGVSGVSLNAAHTARTIAVGGAHPAIMSMMPTVVTGGILLGTSLGAVVVDSPLGILAPLWIGALFALASLATLIPDAVAHLRARGTRRAVPCPEAAAEACPAA